MPDRLLGAAAFAFVLTTATTPCLAAEPTSPEHDAIFRNGLDQYARGNTVAAIATWENLLSTLGEERAYKVLYNLGLAYQATGDVTRAIERYRAFLKQAGKREKIPRDL